MTLGTLLYGGMAIALCLWPISRTIRWAYIRMQPKVVEESTLLGTIYHPKIAYYILLGLAISATRSWAILWGADQLFYSDYLSSLLIMIMVVAQSWQQTNKDDILDNLALITGITVYLCGGWGIGFPLAVGILIILFNSIEWGGILTILIGIGMAFFVGLDTLSLMGLMGLLGAMSIAYLPAIIKSFRGNKATFSDIVENDLA